MSRARVDDLGAGEPSPKRNDTASIVTHYDDTECRRGLVAKQVRVVRAVNR